MERHQITQPVENRKTTPRFVENIGRMKKKLIEVALPLVATNMASAREKSIRHGYPSTLQIWWARRPLAAAWAVIFALMVDDQSGYQDLFKTEKASRRDRVCGLLSRCLPLGGEHEWTESE